MKETMQKFKEGDWIRVPDHNHIFQFISTFTEEGIEYISDGYDGIHGQQGWPIDEVQLWEPKPREWCWFWDNGTNLKTPLLGRFIEKRGKLYLVEEVYKGDDMYLYEECEPFIGILPSYLKGTK